VAKNGYKVTPFRGLVGEQLEVMAGEPAYLTIFPPRPRVHLPVRPRDEGR